MSGDGNREYDLNKLGDTEYVFMSITFRAVRTIVENIQPQISMKETAEPSQIKV